MTNRERGLQIVKMQFRRFLHDIILLPAPIIRSGRRMVCRLLSWNEWMEDFLRTWERLRSLTHQGNEPSKTDGASSKEELSAYQKRRTEPT